MTDYPLEKCVHHLFEQQVEKTPDAIAVVFEDQQLTYGELNSKANQLAHYLRSLGVGPDAIVGICVERSLEMAVGFLGIFKAGGAYLPLDPAYPQERLVFMLEDSQAPIVLTQERLREVLPDCKARVVQLDADWEAMAQQSQDNPVNQTTPENLAYTIYTSGSTGKPKGVMIKHQGVVNHNSAIAKLFKLNASDRVLQFSSISFDIAVEEIFPTWIGGATLVLRSEEMVSSTTDFLRFIAQKQITILDLPTAFWHEMVKEMLLLKQRLPEGVRLVAVGGEKALRSAYLSWLQLVSSNTRWINTYGPTETTVVATVYEPAASPESDAGLSDIPIGRPIDNTEIYILDPQLQPVPIGATGELYIGGAGVARGYLNRPELTQEKFIPNPFTDSGLGEESNNSKSKIQSLKLYKTGDKARYLPDGNIEFLGRIDYQVKIRGFRIELGEIEAALEKHPTVYQIVVVDREDVPGDKRLVAYLVLKQGQQATTSELRSYLRSHLPDYMVPSAFAILDSLPLTPNGKVDRRALPVPDKARPDLEATFVAPRTPVEEVLAGIWAEVLQVERVGIHDNFFEWGGHSLLATQVISRLREALSVQIPLRRIFELPTPAALAEHVETLRWATQSLHPVLGQDDNDREEIEL